MKIAKNKPTSKFTGKPTDKSTSKSANKLNIIGFKEFREKAEKYISRIDKGESFTILKRSRPIFRIVPIGDEDLWETVADFTKLNPHGVSAKDVIKSLRKING